MNNFVITELSLAARLFRSGILKYFDKGELTIYITDFCYHHKSHTINNDKSMANLMIQQGFLKLVELNENQIERLLVLHLKYKPRFVMKTISALVFAEQNNLKVISEDDLVREIAKELNIKAHNKEWLLTTLVNDISTMGINLDINCVKEIV